VGGVEFKNVLVRVGRNVGQYIWGEILGRKKDMGNVETGSTSKKKGEKLKASDSQTKSKGGSDSQ